MAVETVTNYHRSGRASVSTNCPEVSGTRVSSLTKELHASPFLLLEFAEVEKKIEVPPHGSEHGDCLGMARRSGQPAGMGAQRELLGMYGQGWENLKFSGQDFETYPRSNRKPWGFGRKQERNSGAGNFSSRRRPARDWSRGFLTVPQKPRGTFWDPRKG